MLAVLVVASEIGYRKGIRKRGMPDSGRSLMSGTGAAMPGLLGLLLGFTLSMAVVAIIAIVRMYQPKKAILDGSWTFPDPEPVKLSFDALDAYGNLYNFS